MKVKIKQLYLLFEKEEEKSINPVKDFENWMKQEDLKRLQKNYDNRP